MSTQAQLKGIHRSSLIEELESIEVRVWQDLQLAASRNAIEECGVNVDYIGSSVLATATKLDILALNRLIGYGLPGADDQMTLDIALGLAESYGIPRMFVQLAPFENRNRLERYLIKAGLGHYNRWAKFYRDTSPLTDVVSDLRVEAIGIDRADHFAEIFAPSVEWPPAARAWLKGLVGRPGWVHYLAYDGDKPVATAALFVQRQVAWVGFAATLPEYRGRGGQAVLMQRRLADAARVGCDTVVVETAQQTEQRNAPSYRNMNRFGFKLAYLRPNYIWRRPGR